MRLPTYPSINNSNTELMYGLLVQFLFNSFFLFFFFIWMLQVLVTKWGPQRESEGTFHLWRDLFNRGEGDPMGAASPPPHRPVGAQSSPGQGGSAPSCSHPLHLHPLQMPREALQEVALKKGEREWNWSLLWSIALMNSSGKAVKLKTVIFKERLGLGARRNVVG